jgi:sodium-dependent dicarboxylate transporter 2/3/5
MIALAQAAGVNPVPPAIGATFGASWGFMLPVSTPPNAIVYGSGMVPITAMIRAGIFLTSLAGYLFGPASISCCRWLDSHEICLEWPQEGESIRA